MAAISNSSPLILFSRIGELGLMHKVFQEVFIPAGVEAEVTGAGAGRAAAAEVTAAKWIHVRSVQDHDLVGRLRASLDRGEAEAIALAIESPSPSPILLDDRKGRRIAAQAGLTVIGSAGLLIVAKRLGLIPAVRPKLTALRSAGLFLGEAAFQRLLTHADETA